MSVEFGIFLFGMIFGVLCTVPILKAGYSIWFTVKCPGCHKEIVVNPKTKTAFCKKGLYESENAVHY